MKLKVLYGNLSNGVNVKALINALNIDHREGSKFQAYFIRDTQQPQALIAILDKEDTLIINDC